MHLTTTTALVSLCLAATTVAVQVLEFDWPDPSEKLNLSAPLSLNYKYSQSGMFADIPELNVVFHYKRNHTDWLSWTLDIITDYTLSGGHGVVTWDPSELLEMVQEEGHFLAAGRAHYFEATRHKSGGSYSGTGIWSEHYAVEAGKAVDSPAYLARPVGGLVLLGLGVAAVAVM